MSLPTPHFQLGLIGYPLSHSISPQIHTAALKSCGLDGNYSLFPIHTDHKQGLKDLLDRVRSGEIHGLNVTIPHKQNVIEFLDELTPTAIPIGAVNTIYLRNNKLIGDNTDAAGFLTDLISLVDSSVFSFQPSALVIGAGGSARAVMYALINNGWEVTLAARRIEQAEQLAESFMNDQLQITNYELSNIDLSNISLIVNTTPLGMTPNINQSPWPENLPFPPHAIIYDLVYNPQETKFVKDARAQGLSATTGLGMLIEQAALAFETWTSQTPSRKTMHASAEQSLVSNYQFPVTNLGVL
jgi:shikimate dehydrogenase